VWEGEDAAVIRASLDDPARFEVIFDRHYERIRRYAQRRLGRDAGEDVAAQTFVIAFSSRARFDPSYGSAGPWLIGIAANLARRHARSERIRWRALRRTPLEVPAGEVDPTTLDAQRARGAIVQALQILSEADRETFLLHVLGELTYQEVAIVLGVPLGTVRSRIHRARRHLREQMSPQKATGDGDERSSLSRREDDR
jgi:RNA polymerase sigma-70 factor, ECF subfamily